MHSASCTQIESRLRSRHIGFTFEPNLQIDRIREVEGHQVRLIANRAPESMVRRYAEQMRGGAVFPAIVVNERRELIDGNTRLLAARRIGRETIAAYVCGELSALQARSLSVELNQSNGLAMGEEDIRAFIAGAVEDGQTIHTRAYSRMTGIGTARLSRWVAAQEFEMRSRREGIEKERIRGLSDSARAALQAAKLRAVFREAVTLALEAHVPASQLHAIIGEANAAASEAEALAVVARARELRAADVRRHAAGFRRSRHRGAGASIHIGSLLRLEISDLLDVPPERREESFDRMLQLRDRLNGALARARTEWGVAAPDRASQASHNLAGAR